MFICCICKEEIEPCEKHEDKDGYFYCFYCWHKKVEKLWKKFRDISVCPTDGTIEEDFYMWETGTPRIEIWHWFDDNHWLGLVKGLMKIKKEK